MPFSGAGLLSVVGCRLSQQDLAIGGQLFTEWLVLASVKVWGDHSYSAGAVLGSRQGGWVDQSGLSQNRTSPSGKARLSNTAPSCRWALPRFASTLGRSGAVQRESSFAATTLCAGHGRASLGRQWAVTDGHQHSYLVASTVAVQGIVAIDGRAELAGLQQRFEVLDLLLVLRRRREREWPRWRRCRRLPPHAKIATW